MKESYAPDFSLVIPCYNEAGRLPAAIAKIDSWSQQFQRPIEVIIVVEPSTDDTLAYAQSLLNRRWITFTVVPHAKRLGKGGAVRTGMLAALAPIVGFMDADGATDLSFFGDAFAAASRCQAQVIVASRYHRQSIITSKQPLLRRFLSYFFRKFTQTLLHLPVSDSQCGAKVFRHETIRPLFLDLQDFGFGFDVELLLKAVNNGFCIEEQPCIWHDQAGSKVRAISDGLRMAKQVIAWRFSA